MAFHNTPPDERRRIYAALAAGLANGTLTPVVGRRFSLREAPAAHDAIASRGAPGKIVLTVPAELM